MASLMDESDDNLKLARNSSVRKMLHKKGHNLPKPEQVYFSDFVVKINRREKEQRRVLLITDKALYNLMPKDFSSCKRRIKIDDVVSITMSQRSDEFVIHVPEEYDYRFKSSKKEAVARVLADLYRSRTGLKLKVVRKDMHQLKDVTTTKKMARVLSREERLLRRKQLLAQPTDSDREDAEASSAMSAADTADSQQSGAEQLIPSDEKVGPEHFDLMKVIGRGSFGKVMQVRKKDTGVIYAMKILKKSAIVARNQVEHTKAERKILQTLQHPFLMRLRYAFQTKGKLYFVLDYYRGGELFFHLKQKRRFTEAEARIIVAEVGLAIGHLHSLDVIYRDLKPENILLDHDGHLCLTDFGLSKDLDPDNPYGTTFCGTPEYLAPEIVMGCEHGKPVDWWSLGILLYELTVGIPPFYSQNVNEMYRRIQHGVLRFPPTLSDECKDLIIKLLNRDPDARLGSSPADIEEIKTHPFFDVLDWTDLMEKKIEPVYKPVVTSKDDVSNFDPQFTEEMPIESVDVDAPMGDIDGFTFQGGSALR